MVPVHHLRSHIAANYLSYENLKPPFLCLVVSGGNTLITEVKDYTDFKILGRTRDDAAGEALDKAARTLGLDYPGGVNLDKIAKNGNSDSYKFPRPHVDGSPLDFSFSGLKTSVINLIHNAEQKGETVSVPDVGASFLKAVVDSLEDNIRKALDSTGYDKLVLAGGVSANSVLRERMLSLAKEKNVEIYFPELSLCGDNAAMVGAQGYFEYVSGTRGNMTLNARATLDIDSVQ